MTDKNINDIAEIENAQAGLRESIEATKQLSERAEHLLQRCKARTARDAPSSGERPRIRH
ncbi:hypothetical protein PIB19_14535 [Sphingomonas sp. 7/4-4]|uniref:hypothetical protein n=1 Tax=Sphingomonas sp. 7/4-4 TaxID=3018446 RepID=UPI0022F3FC87|nr:hypothetical protein [Sphingomonas sp. 7/4-4]WBY06740.1 hypothetical protein PIB19_14535 [Sphingomonas sp. 7/4-4]